MTATFIFVFINNSELTNKKCAWNSYTKRKKRIRNKFCCVKTYSNRDEKRTSN